MDWQGQGRRWIPSILAEHSSVFQHVVSYPVSPAFVNVGYFDTTPGGLGQPLPGPSMVAASREEIMNLYKGWEEDLQVAAKVCTRASLNGS